MTRPVLRPGSRPGHPLGVRSPRFGHNSSWSAGTLTKLAPRSRFSLSSRPVAATGSPGSESRRPPAKARASGHRALRQDRRGPCLRRDSHRESSPKANGADPKVDPTLTDAWIPEGTLGDRCRCLRPKSPALSPALAPASGSVGRLVRTEVLSVHPAVPRPNLRPVASNGCALRPKPSNAPSAPGREIRPMATLLRVLLERPTLRPAEAFSEAGLEDRADSCRHPELV
jgi:hypothetical protein